MNYKDLPLEKRMVMASEYAVLLLADMKPVEQIIPVLQQDFDLTEEQARQAYADMRQNHRAAYNSTVNSNLLKTFGIIGFGGVGTLFYFFAGKEAGWFFWVFAVIFGLTALGGLLLLGGVVGERFKGFANAAQGKYQPPIPKKWLREAWNTAFTLGFMFTIFMGIQYYFRIGTIDGNEIATVRQLIITEPVRFDNTGGKVKSYYYVFKFRGHNNEFRFFDRYYEYANYAIASFDCKEGDTVAIQIFNDDLEYLSNQYSTKDIKIVNLAKGKGFYIDHARRNTLVQQSNKANFKFTGLFLLAVIVIALVWHLYHYVKWRLTSFESKVALAQKKR